MASGANRNWSADHEFIFDLTVLRRLFMERCVHQDLNGMITSLKLLFYVCEPKLLTRHPEEEEEMIKHVESKMWTTQFVDGQTNRLVETDGTRYNKKVLMDYTEKIFRSLLIKLQKAGIYTRNVANITDSLGDFEGG